jgi:hypothetical protein
MRAIFRTILIFASVAFSLPTIAGESAQSLANAGMPSQCADFGAKVSASEGNFGTTNQFGCLGAFQFCPGTFQQYYSDSAQSFLNSPSAQVSAWTQYEQDEWAKAQNAGLISLVGQQACTGGNCFTVTNSSILMACQFGCGSKGKLANFEANGDQCIQGNNPSKPNGGSSPTNDGNGVCVATYLKKGTGYDVSCFTNGAQEKQGNGGCPSPTDASGGVLASNASTSAPSLPSAASQPAIASTDVVVSASQI